jgi:hypothetical protein
MEVVHLGPKTFATAGSRVRTEHNGNPTADFRVTPQRRECRLGVAMCLQVVLPSEAFAEIAHKQLAHVSVVMDDTQEWIRPRLRLAHDLLLTTKLGSL